MTLETLLNKLIKKREKIKDRNYYWACDDLLEDLQDLKSLQSKPVIEEIMRDISEDKYILREATDCAIVYTITYDSLKYYLSKHIGGGNEKVDHIPDVGKKVIREGFKDDGWMYYDNQRK